MSLYLRDFGIFKQEGIYKVSFEIPENCEYTLSVDSKNVNTIAVALKSGETVPSEYFTTEVQDFPAVDEIVIADFELPDVLCGDDNGGIITKKPRLKIYDLKP